MKCVLCVLKWTCMSMKCVIMYDDCVLFFSFMEDFKIFDFASETGKNYFISNFSPFHSLTIKNVLSLKMVLKAFSRYMCFFVASYFMPSNDDLHNNFAQFCAINCIGILHENRLRHCADIKHEVSFLLHRRFSIFNEK